MMLPSDRYLADVLGLTEEQYRHFQIEVRKRAAEGPQPAVVAGTEIIIAAVSLAISVGATAVSLLFKPSIPQATQAPGQPRRIQETTDPVNRNTNFAPRFGFDSQQDIATLGSTIPIVYAKREEISGTTYGGIRINTPMLWNQILSLGGGQLLRGVFLLAEGTVSSIDENNFAIGSNTLRGYLFDLASATVLGSRVAVYFSPDGGRIAGTDRVFGRTEAFDPGSSGSDDVFRVFYNGQERTDFCASTRPSTQTTFGVYAPIGNNLMYKVNPIIRPGVRSQNVPKSTSQSEVKCPVDAPVMNTRDKYRAEFSTFSGVFEINSVEGSGTIQSFSSGVEIKYRLFKDSDFNTEFDQYPPSNQVDGDPAEAKDVASAVASIQKTWDDRLVVGEVYKIGSGLAVCTDRAPDGPFISEADDEGDTNTGVSITATFTAVEPGSVKCYSRAQLREKGGDDGLREKATTGGHLLRYARANISNSRPCSVVEIGLRSNLGIRLNGICNFRDTKTYKYADENFCEAQANAVADDIVNKFYQSGVITSAVERYSFFKIRYREIGDSAWTVLDNAYGVRSETQQSVFNYIRLEFSEVKQREFQFDPLSGFEIRNQFYGTNATLYVLDAKSALITPISENGVTVVFNGESVPLSIDQFKIAIGEADPKLNLRYTYTEVVGSGGGAPNTKNYDGLDEVDRTNVNAGSFVTGLKYIIVSVGNTDFTLIGAANNNIGTTFIATGAGSGTGVAAGAGNYIDNYGKLAETFVYSEVTSSADSAPEHEIVYVNEIVPNSTAPLYDDLALVGINIRSSAEFQQFAQFSTYVTGGKVCSLFPLSGGTTGATHLFPEVLYDLLTNTRYGAGSFIKADMIDADSFAAAAQWCQARKYFYDAAIAEPINVRQFAADLSATHLLQFGESDGKYFLKLALPANGASLNEVAPIAGLFTAGNIAEDSFQLQYFDPEERDPIQISVRYREERPSTDLNSPGLFPVVREVLVREDVPEASETDPTEQVDVSDFCTSREHAIDAAKFLIRMRRIPTHTISFATTHDAVISSLAPGDYIKVAMDETEYDEFNNGVVTPEGALVSTKALADGTYNVVAWDGTEGTPPADTTLTVSNGGKIATPTGVVFTVKLPSTQIRVYQIERISPTDDGTFTIEALHMPVNSSGVLLVADGFDTAGNWVIEG